MENSLVDKVLDECSQIRILVVGASRGKAQLIREIFGVNRVTRYPPDFSRDEEVYSKENEYFVAHVYDNWRGVIEVLKRRRRGEPDEVIHSIWHYVDSQDACDLTAGNNDGQMCPEEVRRLNIPVITFFGRFDNIVNRAAEIGKKRRSREGLSEMDKNDGAQIRKVMESIDLWILQYPRATAIASKSPSSKLTFLNIVLATLKSNPAAQMLMIIAQRLNPSLKFETSMNLAMKQFLLGTISTASPLPIPFAGLIGNSAATYLIKEDIIRVWNIYDPEYLCAGASGEASLMDTLLGIPKMGIKRLVYMIPVIAQIKGIWETPRIAKALGGLMIDLMLLMERAFLATMGGIADGSSPIRTPARTPALQANSPKTPIRPLNHAQNGGKTPLSTEVLRHRQQLMSPLNPGKSPSPMKPHSSRPGSMSLLDLTDDDNSRPATPPRPSSSSSRTNPAAPPTTTTTTTMPYKPALPPKPARPTTPISSIVPNISTPPTTPGVQALELQSPTSSSHPIAIRPSSLPLTHRMLRTIMSEYAPVQAEIKLQLDDFFNQEGEGLKRSFQKDTVRRELDSIVRKYRISEVVSLD